MEKWWGNQGKRNKPHEGLDLCFYRDSEGRILHLDDHTRIPVLYEGVVVRIVDDFIGQTVFMEHHLPDSNPPTFYTIYGHTTPLPGLHDGKIVKEGEILATLAHPGKSRSDIPPHLHLSIVWLSKKISFETLDWETMSTSKTLKWVDPLQIVNRHMC